MLKLRMNYFSHIPLSLYIHFPWCIQKCPYCDFNSHPVKGNIPEKEYVEALINDLNQNIAYTENREIISIFFGGGTPSLITPEALHLLIETLNQKLQFAHDIEITLEANPGTVERQRFQGFYQAGINRLSIGVQSFDPEQLKKLGRIHNGEEAKKAIEAAHHVGFNNINIDIMHALPDQTLEQAMYDLETAILFHPQHLSWYQLTLEPNTLFYKKPPTLPNDRIIDEIQQRGQHILSHSGYQHYEVSAYSQKNYQSRHNLNYWEFGDYLGIGAGSHSKLTDLKKNSIQRIWKYKHPKHYLDPSKSFIEGQAEIKTNDRIFEFMLNALRLKKPIPIKLFENRTGLSISEIKSTLEIAKNQNLLTYSNQSFLLTDLGHRFLNNVTSLFLSSSFS